MDPGLFNYPKSIIDYYRLNICTLTFDAKLSP